MPTRHRRVGVVLDPELSEALRLAAKRLDASTEAARVRELALIGARSLSMESDELQQARGALDAVGATRERGDLLAVSRRLRRRRGRRREETATESLDWVRGTR
jgi:hypothetical protein